MYTWTQVECTDIVIMLMMAADGMNKLAKVLISE